MIKQRNASIEMYIQGKRDDLVKIEENEIKIISNFCQSNCQKMK